MTTQPKLTRFNEHVLSKYQIYNSIFMTLPYDTITNTGVLLPLFHEVCKTGFSEGQNPSEIIVALPVGPPSIINKIKNLPAVNNMICLIEPKNFRAVGQFYEEFQQVNDEEVIKLLKSATDNLKRH